MKRARRWWLVVVAVVTLIVILMLALVLGLVMFTGGSQLKQAQQKAAQMCMPAGVGGLSADGEVAIPAVGQVTSAHGPRPNPFGPGVLPPGFTSEAGLIYHNGVDIGGMATGAPIYAAVAGRVETVMLGGTRDGNGVLIDIGGGVKMLYWHMANDTIIVKEGDMVAAGQQIGGAGMTGGATGVHLHMEVRANGEKIDPAAFFAPRGLILELRKPARLTTPATPDNPASATASALPGPWAPVSASISPDSSSVSSSTRPGGSSASGSGLPALSGPVRVALPDGGQFTLTDAQVRNASMIIGIGRQMELSDQAIITALMTALQESTLLMYASPAVPESFNFPHEKIGANKQSVGVFQQQWNMGWGSVPELMNLEYSTRAFFGGPTGPNQGEPRGLLDIPGWQTLRPGTAAQLVQGSAHPEAYHQWQTTATQILGMVTGTVPVGVGMGGCAGLPGQPGDQTSIGGEKAPDEGSAKVAIPAGMSRSSIVASAERGVGGMFTFGQADFRSWDASGLVYWVYRDSGVQVARTSPWSAGTRTETPRPGDLVAQQWDAERKRWNHVGIYVGEGMMISAINEGAGTRKHPVTQTGENPVYFDILQEQQ